MQFLFFLSAFSVVLFGAHALLGFSIAHFFALVSTRERFVLASVLFLLAVGFFGASVVAHWRDTVLTRSLYFLSAFWLGLLVNLLLASLCVWGIAWVVSYFGGVFQYQSVVAAILFVSAGLVSIYGSWNAFHPVVTEVGAHIPNLPEQWKGKKIVQLSDVHLGFVYRAHFLRRIVAQVNALHPDIVVITGDLFDGMDGSLETLAEPLGALQSTYGTLFVTGNHETYLGVDVALRALQGTNVRRLDNEAIDIDGLTFVGISYPERGVTTDMPALLKRLQPSFEGKPNVLLFHAPTYIEAFRSAGINLQLSGHTHVGQLFPFRYITKLIYHGHDYGLYEEGAYSLYTTNGLGTWGPAIRTGNAPEIVSILLR